MNEFYKIGGVGVMGFISPMSTDDTYAVVDPLYGIDGFRNVDTMQDMLEIPEERRRAGMIVGVNGGQNYYKLKDTRSSKTEEQKAREKEYHKKKIQREKASHYKNNE